MEKFGTGIRYKHPGSAALVMKAKDYVVSSCSDMKSLLKNKSFVLSTIAFTCVTYCAGAMMWWGPNFAFAGAPAFKFCAWIYVEDKFLYVRMSSYC
jgi:hypothetical protein